MTTLQSPQTEQTTAICGPARQNPSPTIHDLLQAASLLQAELQSTKGQLKSAQDTIQQQVAQLTEEQTAVRKQEQLIQKQEQQIHDLKEERKKDRAKTKRQEQRIQALTEKISNLKEEKRLLKNALAKFQKAPKAPKLRPNVLENSNKDKQKRKKGKKGKKDQKGKGTGNRTTNVETIRIAPENIPEGSTFKGCSRFTVQELMIVAKTFVYKLERWLTPDGKTIRGKLPESLRGGHYGAALLAYASILHHKSFVTEQDLLALLKSFDVKISSGQLHNILHRGMEEFVQDQETILQAGLEHADYIGADDTGALHKHRNGYCLNIGGEWFSYFKTTGSKSRLNFISILVRGEKTYTINEEALSFLHAVKVKEQIVNKLEKYKGKVYKTEASYKSFLTRLQIYDEKLRNLLFEAGLIGTLFDKYEHLPALITDGAKQFCHILAHALCWVHKERPLRKIIATTPEIEKEIARVRKAIWKLYSKLKDYTVVDLEKKKRLSKEFDKLTRMETSSPEANKVLASFAADKDKLLLVLDHPDIPLHNNGCENDIRAYVKKRKISGSTRNESGRILRDAMMTVLKTCQKLHINPWTYLKDRYFCLKEIPLLGDLVKEAYSPSMS